jgi:uracil-DNA glycosylase
MKLDEDYLREMELWPLFALRGRIADLSSTTQMSSPSSETKQVAAATVETYSPPQSTARHAVPPTRAREIAKPALLPAQPVSIDPARAAKIATLDFDGLATAAATCTACGLCKQRKQAVVGVGALDAPWLFVGEGPGADEDQQGEPFVGQAGKLLDAMLQAAGLARGREVFIANVVKCRPPGNRTPTVDEAAACAPFLDRQIDLIKPKLIVALGKTAVTRLTGSDASMASLRGQAMEYRGIPVIATYHPAYLLRNLPEKLKAWEDLIFARQKMVALTGSL